MRWMDFEDDESDEWGQATVLDWAQERPLLAAVMVLLGWVAFIVALTTVYSLFL